MSARLTALAAALAAALTAALAACAPSPERPAEWPAPSAAGSETPAVTLERRPCLGTCPVYTVTISADGTIRYVGRHHVAHQGEATAAIPPARVDSLLTELEAGGYFEFAADYVMDAPACGRYAADSPTVVTSVTRDGRIRTVRHDYGCSAAPRELVRLERRIDEVAGTGRWTGR